MKPHVPTQWSGQLPHKIHSMSSEAKKCYSSHIADIFSIIPREPITFTTLGRHVLVVPSALGVKIRNYLGYRNVPTDISLRRRRVEEERCADSSFEVIAEVKSEIAGVIYRIVNLFSSLHCMASKKDSVVEGLAQIGHS